MPGIVVGVLRDGRSEVTALGSVAGEPDPASLCWEIGSITKVFTGLLLAEMSLRGEVRLDDPIGRYLPDEVAARLPAPTSSPLWPTWRPTPPACPASRGPCCGR